MNYGCYDMFDKVCNHECMWINTLPNNTILVQYNDANEVCEIVKKLKGLDITFSRNKPWNFVPNYLFGANGYKEIKSIKFAETDCEGCDYSPVVYMFTNNGEYGYSQLTVYMSSICGEPIIAYEHQYKGALYIRYYLQTK